jgi:hypothetical protein
VSSATTAATANARAADGDYKTKGSGHTVKDSDGDYKPTSKTTTAPPTSPAATSSNAVQAALANLTKGG